MRIHNKKGFTLAELLIVVAIIAVLVAIAIPIFTNQLEKSREATDAANIRNGIAAVTVDYLNADTVNNDGYSAVISLKQQTNDWETGVSDFRDAHGSAISVTNSPASGGSATVKIDKTGSLSITYAGPAGGGD